MLIKRDHKPIFCSSLIILICILTTTTIIGLSACKSSRCQHMRRGYDDWGNDYSAFPPLQTTHPNVRIEKFHEIDVKALDGGLLDSIPEIIIFQEPKYPDLAAAAGIEGVLFIEVTIDQDGQVNDAKYITGRVTPSMQNAALEAVRKFKYRPALRDNQPIACKVVHGFYFELSSK